MVQAVLPSIVLAYITAIAVLSLPLLCSHCHCCALTATAVLSLPLPLLCSHCHCCALTATATAVLSLKTRARLEKATAMLRATDS